MNAEMDFPVLLIITTCAILWMTTEEYEYSKQLPHVIFASSVMIIHFIFVASIQDKTRKGIDRKDIQPGGLLGYFYFLYLHLPIQVEI